MNSARYGPNCGQRCPGKPVTAVSCPETVTNELTQEYYYKTFNIEDELIQGSLLHRWTNEKLF